MQDIESKGWDQKKELTPSSNIFEALKSPYMTWFTELCKKARPRAAPIAILILLSQDSRSLFGIPACNQFL